VAFMEPTHSNAPATASVPKKKGAQVTLGTRGVRLSRPRIWGFAAFVTFALIVFGGIWELSRPIPYPPPEWTSIWKYLLPLEFHAEQKLPAFDNANIRAVEVVPNSNRVWIAGDQGVLAYSDDGFAWTIYDWDPVAGVPKKRVATTQSPTSSRLTLFPTASAASLPQAGQSNPPPTVQSQTNQQRQQIQQQAPVGKQIPLQISESKLTQITDDSVVVIWSTNLPADSQVEYGTSIKYGSRVTDPSLLTAHRIILAKLQPQDIYHYRVISQTKDGQKAAGDDRNFMIVATTSGVPIARVTRIQLSVSIIAPSSNAVVSGVVVLSARVSGGEGGRSLQFTIDGKSVGTPMNSGRTLRSSTPGNSSTGSIL